MKKCFVISPIGPSGSEIREHADDVFDFIIEPAAKATGFEAKRGDHASMPGKISNHMFERILGDPLIIAVLNFDNPNVFYEVAVAHAAARPMIILCEKSQSLPFDIKDHRVIFYDLRPRPIVGGIYKEELIKAIEEVTRLGETVEVPFGNNLIPLGGRGLDPGFKLYNKLLEAVTGDTYPRNIISEATRHITFSGLTLGSLHTLAGFEFMLEAAIGRGCHVSAFLMHEDNTALDQMLMDKSQISRVRHDIIDSTERWQALVNKHPNLELIKVRDGMLLHQTTMNEQKMLIIPYWTSMIPDEAPAIATNAGSSLFVASKNELESLKKRNPAWAH